jgi:hypothetical protein
MPNQYGTSNPLPVPQFIYIASNTACPAGAETNVLSATLAAVSPGIYYPVMIGAIYITLGATAPSQILIGGRIGAGADFQQLGAPAEIFTPNLTYLQSFCMFGTPSDTIWRGAGATVNISLNPTGQAVTAASGGSYGQVFLFRAPDQ